MLVVHREPPASTRILRTSPAAFATRRIPGARSRPAVAPGVARRATRTRRATCSRTSTATMAWPTWWRACTISRSNPESTGKVGAVGFCFGGGLVDMLAMNSPDLLAAVAYYGPIPADKSKVKDIKAKLLLHYAGLDKGVNANIPAWEEALKAAGKSLHCLHLRRCQSTPSTTIPAERAYATSCVRSRLLGRTIAFLKDMLGARPTRHELKLTIASKGREFAAFFVPFRRISHHLTKRGQRHILSSCQAIIERDARWRQVIPRHSQCEP